ncbi:MAG: hypothetical protein K940chlam3_00378 [Chlamydiae bacterium]|nr:hypothetical protein [Chlamydiota bacterium]
MQPIDYLPNEILTYICLHLEPEEIRTACSLVSRRWYGISTNSIILEKYAHIWGTNIINKFNDDEIGWDDIWACAKFYEKVPEFTEFNDKAYHIKFDKNKVVRLNLIQRDWYHVQRHLPSYRNITELRLESCELQSGRLKSLPITLKKLSLKQNQFFACLRTMGMWVKNLDEELSELPQELTALEILGSKDIIGTCFRNLPPTLTYLNISGCKNISEYNFALFPTSLKTLNITNCEQFQCQLDRYYELAYGLEFSAITINKLKKLCPDVDIIFDRIQ